MDGDKDAPGDPSGRDKRSRDEPEEIVSRESVPCSTDDIGRGGAVSAGARRPFLVVADAEREVRLNRPLAFGADATRRMKREAVAPTDFGVNGPGREEEAATGKEVCEGPAVRDFELPGTRESAVLCFSDLVRGRDLAGEESASTEC